MFCAVYPEEYIVFSIWKESLLNGRFILRNDQYGGKYRENSVRYFGCLTE